MNRDDAIELVKKGFEQLEAALKAGRSDELIRYLSTMSKFHNYSMRNMMLIWMQNPDATMVAGFRTWQKLGRNVKKGQKGIAIFAPMPFRAKSDEKTNSSDQDSEETQMMGFKVVHVFDISQTEGDELPQPAKIAGHVGENLARIEQVVEQSDIELVFEAIDDGANGYSSGGKITIDESLDDVQKFAVIAHELAHERLHHGERRAETTKTIRETEAESVAFIVCNAFGLDAKTHSADYIQLYNGDSDTLKESLKYIQSTAEWMIDEINSVGLPCDHASPLRDDSGRLNGTWVKKESVSPARYCCGVCQKFYGYESNKSAVSAGTV